MRVRRIVFPVWSVLKDRRLKNPKKVKRSVAQKSELNSLERKRQEYNVVSVM
jgi:hypothetical protein